MNGPDPAAFRLPRGPHSLTPELVSENQRWRLIAAAGQVIADGGILRATSSAIARRAGVSQTTFYEHFDDVPGCLLAAYESAAQCLLAVADRSCGGDRDATSRISFALSAILDFLVDERALASLLADQGVAAISGVVEARERLIGRLAEMLASARDRPSVPRGAGARERRLVAGALVLAAESLRSGDQERLRDRVPQLSRLLGDL